VRKIEDLHALIVGNLNVSTGLRKGLVGITGTTYRPLDNQYQIKEALEKTIFAIEKIEHPLEKALTAILMISYIQPFEDGNKRTARILGNAILMAYGFCPLSYRSINESDYKKAILLFYEQNSALLFKELFVEQFKFAINNYFLA
jgi:Fic family protein